MYDRTEWFPPRQAQKLLGYSYSTLRRRADDGSIQYIVLPSGHRLYKIPNSHKITKMAQNQKICYCRVSTKKQAQDLDNQVKYCQQRFPDHQIITDIGNALNFNRKGIKTLLDKVYSGQVQQIVVTHKDRLATFGLELFQYIFDKHQVKLLVLDQMFKGQLEEFNDDLISIVTVFTARYYGKQKYKSSSIKKNKTFPQLEPKTDLS